MIGRGCDVFAALVVRWKPVISPHAHCAHDSIESAVGKRHKGSEADEIAHFREIPQRYRSGYLPDNFREKFNDAAKEERPS